MHKAFTISVSNNQLIATVVVALKWSSFAFIISLFCFVISIYLALPTFQNFDWLFGSLSKEVRLQLLVLATAFFIFGIAILLACIITLTIKRILFKAELITSCKIRGCAKTVRNYVRCFLLL
jgi:hypothetical protein